VEINVTVNGTAHTNDVEPRTLLVHYVRDSLGLTGTNIGCDTSSCGACTLHLDGEAVKSCTVLAVQADGSEVTTIEGLARDGELHPVQAAFIDHDAFQCGYCTPGQILSAVALIEEGPLGSDDEIRDHMSGNICRCGAYTNIVAAVRDAAARMS
jgi:carbon-monoxide dehydrogenase small subunit